MRIKSNLRNNTSVLVKGGQNVTIPAGALLELDDSTYLKVAKQLAPLVDSGKLVIVKSVAKTAEQTAEDKAKRIAEAKAILAEAEAEAKATLAEAEAEAKKESVSKSEVATKPAGK